MVVSVLLQLVEKMKMPQLKKHGERGRAEGGGGCRPGHWCRGGRYSQNLAGSWLGICWLQELR